MSPTSSRSVHQIGLDTLAEWLRRCPAIIAYQGIVFARAGSNPAGVVSFCCCIVFPSFCHLTSIRQQTGNSHEVTRSHKEIDWLIDRLPTVILFY
jgi:hypothetical protein